ncbi:unnamed protein product [Rhodiola kirilowii]
MAARISSSAHSWKPPTNLHVITILSLLAALTFRSTSALTLNLTTFTVATDNFCFGDSTDYYNNATIEAGSLVLTKMVTWKTGRVTYNESVHLWDAASNSLADFSTHFSFVIDSFGKKPYADGLAFFLAPVGFPMPAQEGSGLGMVSGRELYNASSFPFVAVEFDTFENERFIDRPSDHVGIDVGSMESVAWVRWNSSVLDGKPCEAWINYDAASKELSVLFTGFDNNVAILQSLNYTIDLRKILPEFVCLGFGAATGQFSAVHSIRSWWFDSKLVALNETSNIAPPPNQVIGSAQPVSARSRIGLISGSVSGAIVVLIVLVVGFIVWRKRGSNKELRLGMDEEFENETGPKRYSYKELQRATRNFDEKNKLGEGGFGGVYKGLIDKTTVAIKRVSKESRQGVKEYASEIRVISKLRHRNLVQLLGWCHERDEMLLVYEFMPNRSLDTHLFKSEIALTWASRFKIAQGLASALLYLHEGCNQYVVHRDIKSSNVMLDSAFNTKLGDFGLARLVDHLKISETTNLAGTRGYIDPESVITGKTTKQSDLKISETTVLAGTRGYIDPESIITGKTTKQSDIYSFGVLAIEISCGRKPIDDHAPENEVSLVDWVYDLNHEGKLLDAVDPRLENDYNEAELQCLLLVGLWCAQPTQVSRPTIRQASLVLNFEAPLPTLPDRFPNTLSYFQQPATGPNGCSIYNQSNTEPSMATTSSSVHSIPTDSIQMRPRYFKPIKTEEAVNARLLRASAPHQQLRASWAKLRTYKTRVWMPLSLSDDIRLVDAGDWETDIFYGGNNSSASSSIFHSEQCKKKPLALCPEALNSLPIEIFSVSKGICSNETADDKLVV